MKFSIIIPTYNRSHIIEKTIQSVLNQKYDDYEVIIVDNCSTDNTVELLQKYLEDTRYKLIINSENYERSYSRNVGISNASGDYLTFLDSDDIMGEDCLLDAFEFATKNKGFAIFHNKFLFCDSSGRILKKYQVKPDYQNPYMSILAGNFLACIGVFINKEIYSKFRFIEEKKLIGSEDWLFWIQIINSTSKLGLISKVNSFLVDHSERTENNRDPHKFEQQIMGLKEFVFENLNLSKAEKRVFEFSTSYIIAVDFCDAGKKRLALKKIYPFLKRYPLHVFSLRTMILFKNILFRF